MKYILPVMFLLILGYALYKKVRPYDAFVSGAGQAIPFAVKLFPYLAAIFVLTELFEASGASDAVSKFLAPAFRLLGIPEELSKLVLIKPFSGNGALALLTEIYETYGVDSYIARCASVIYGSSETVFYVAAVYFAGSKTKNLTAPIVISLAASLFACVFACFICRVM